MLLQAIIAIGTLCASHSISEDLRQPFCSALWAWFPYRPDVNSVQWCFDEYGCLSAQVGQGGGYEASSGTITIDKRWPWTEHNLVLTLEHEVGHALGLEHTAEGIMKSGWDPPIAQGPSPADFAALAKLH